MENRILGLTLRIITAWMLLPILVISILIPAAYADNDALMAQVYSSEYSGVTTMTNKAGDTLIHYYPNGGQLNADFPATAERKSEYSTYGYMTLRHLADYDTELYREFVEDVYIRIGGKQPYVRPGYRFSGWSFDPEGRVMVTTSSPTYSVLYRKATSITAAEYAEGTPVLINRTTYQGILFGQQPETTAQAIIRKYLPVMVDNFYGEFRIWPYDMDYTATRHINLYAQWEEIAAYTVSYNANGGTGSMLPTSVEEGNGAYLSLNGFTRSGYEFTGWNTAADGSGNAYRDGGLITPTGDMMLYAQWRRTEIPCAVSLVLNYPLPGETFGEGYFESNGAGAELDIRVSAGGHALQQNLWSRYPPNGTIITSSDKVQTDVMYYTTISAWPESGYYWESEDAQVEVRCSAYPGTEYYTDKWETAFTSDSAGKHHTLDMFMFNSINYGLGGGKITSAPGTYPTYVLFDGASMQMSALPHAEKAGYIFLGWEDSNGSVIDPDNTAMVLKTKGGTEPFTFNAVWEKIPTSTITFHANDGSGRSTEQTVNRGVSVPLDEVSFSRRGYTFAKWTVSPDGSGSGYADRATLTAYEDISLYAQWVPAPDYTVIVPEGAGISVDKDTGMGTGEIGIETGSVIPEDKALRISLNAGRHYDDLAKSYRLQNTDGEYFLPYLVNYKGRGVNPNSSNGKAVLETVDADTVYSGFTGNITVQVGLPKAAGLYKDVLTFTFSVV